jgi:hypothetical protein
MKQLIVTDVVPFTKKEDGGEIFIKQKIKKKK